MELGVDSIELGAQGALALAQLGGAGAQLLERDELFLVGLDQPGGRALRVDEVTLERLATPGGGLLGAQRGEPPVDLGADKRWRAPRRPDAGTAISVHFSNSTRSSGARSASARFTRTAYSSANARRLAISHLNTAPHDRLLLDRRGIDRSNSKFAIAWEQSSRRSWRTCSCTTRSSAPRM
jgi:hypothetical protein